VTNTVAIDSATVYTLIHYTESPEVRKYTVEDSTALANLLMDMRDPVHAERVIDVEVTADE